MSVIRLHANESPFPLEDELRKRILKRLGKVPFNYYPDENSQGIKDGFSSYLGVDSNEIVIGNGSDELIGNLIFHYLSEKDRILFFQREFSMYSYYAKKRGVEIVYYDRPIDSLDLEGLIETIERENISMFMFSNPNNPTGSIIPREQVLTLAQQLPQVKIVVDEAYGEFAKESILRDFRDYENIYILKTLSKAFGMAALRVGGCITIEDNAQELEMASVPYNVNALSQAVCQEIFQKDSLEKMAKNVDYIIQERDRLYSQLLDLNLDQVVFYPSSANFIYGESRQKEELLKLCKKEGIWIRDFSGTDAFRISIGLREQNDSIYKIIKRCYSEK